MWRRHEPLAGRTTFGVGGPAEWFATPETEEECAAAWREAQGQGWRTRVLGGGSNLLIADEGVSGAVLCTRRLRPQQAALAGVVVRISAGAPLPALVAQAAKAGWSGLEFLAGVPGLAGGAACMNAGGHARAFGELVQTVRVVDREGRLSTRRGRDIPWRYRSWGLDDPVILGVELRLAVSSPEQVAAATRAALERKRKVQPLGWRSAGCVFRNLPDASAGRLLDEAGLKGARIGGAAISEKHANFVVNVGGATAADIAALIRLARNKVLERTGRTLQLEIHSWPGGLLSSGGEPEEV